jgi:type II secretory pathway pseudopilin PulG
MKKKQGVTLIELLIFIVVMGILGSSILISFNTVFKGIGRVTSQTSTTAYAVSCLEWFLGQRSLKGFASISCSNTVPAFCSDNLPSDYNISTNVSCTTYYGDATNYKTITTTVNSDISSANLSLILANY